MTDVDMLYAHQTDRELDMGSPQSTLIHNMASAENWKNKQKFGEQNGDICQW